MTKDREELKTAHLVSLGCARNRVDSEVMLGCLIEDGWKIVDSPEDAAVIIVNTCSFIKDAKEESIDVILSMAEIKKTGFNVRLVVTGCLTQRYQKDLLKGFPEVDLFIGTDEFHRINELLKDKSDSAGLFAKRTNYIYSGKLPRINTLSTVSAYVKIAEGCDHACSFCIIPKIRGRLRSRSVSDITQEVKELASQGILEIILVAQDLAAYGRDLGNVTLLDLLKSLVNIDGIEWIRL
ncbi:MAG: radical SAM protein, partial [Oligoflexales bacterium]|nr:radical SAM protein [Oligoflexales bacterium]